MIPGRGEFIRWILEDAEIPYVDVGRRDGIDAIVTARQHGIALADGRRARFFAPPALVLDEVVVAQTALIAQTLGERLGRAPEGRAGRATARNLTGLVMDVVKEAHDVHHPVSPTLTYEAQAEEAKRSARVFLSDRLPSFLTHFEDRLAEFDGPYVFGASPTYVDFVFVPLLRGLDHAFPRAMAEFPIPRLRVLQASIQARPALAAYRRSERCIPYSEHGIFRYYPELDLPSQGT